MKDSLELPVMCPVLNKITTYMEKACRFQLMGKEDGEKAASWGPSIKSRERQSFRGACVIPWMCVETDEAAVDVTLEMGT